MKYRFLAILPVYLGLFVLTPWIAAWLLQDFEVTSLLAGKLVDATLAIVSVKAAVWLASREWRRSYRYSGFVDVMFTACVCAAWSVVLIGWNWLSPGGLKLPTALLVLDAGLSVLLFSALRSSFRGLAEARRIWNRIRDRHDPRPKALIFGVGARAVELGRAVQEGDSTYNVVGFLSPSERPSQSLVLGRPVWSIATPWEDVHAKSDTDHLLIPGQFTTDIAQDLLTEIRGCDVEVHVVPEPGDIMRGRIKLAAPDVAADELLRRAPNDLDTTLIGEYLTGKTVLVTGGAGSIGSELCRQLLAFRPGKLIVLDQSEFGVFSIEREFAQTADPEQNIEYEIADICDAPRLEQIMSRYRPEIVFHAAAYKHVPLMERIPHAAVQNNVGGTKTLADLADAFGVKRFLLVSTDKAVRPTSIMGSTKLLAEKYVQGLASTSATKFLVVRFGNVLDSAGSVIPTFRKQIEAGGPVTVTHPDMERFFMTIPEAAQLVLQAGAIGHSGDIMILDMGQPVKIVDLAKDLIELSGKRYPEEVDIVFSGMRPGEKLYEELFYSEENGAARVHPKIFQSAPQRIDRTDVTARLGLLFDSLAEPAPGLIEALKRTVAHFAETAPEMAPQTDTKRAA